MPAIPPERVVQNQLDAYNRRDLEGLLAAYADHAVQVAYPGAVMAEGKAQIRERMAARLGEPELHAHLVQRVVAGNFIIGHELVSRSFPEGPCTLELLCQYEVAHGAIVRATFTQATMTARGAR